MSNPAAVSPLSQSAVSVESLSASQAEPTLRVRWSDNRPYLPLKDVDRVWSQQYGEAYASQNLRDLYDRSEDVRIRCERTTCCFTPCCDCTIGREMWSHHLRRIDLVEDLSPDYHGSPTAANAVWEPWVSGQLVYRWLIDVLGVNPLVDPVWLLIHKSMMTGLEPEQPTLKDCLTVGQAPRPGFFLLDLARRVVDALRGREANHG